jgi:hypothetical protein
MENVIIKRMKYKTDPVSNGKKMNKGIPPLPLRCLIVGTSGWKPSLLYNLIMKKCGIPFLLFVHFFEIFRTRHI